jgi:ABC-type nitrate/sulfonate/bicarbonate transport system substrate-binding protein
LLVASQDFISKRPDTLAKVLSAINDAQGIVDADPLAAQQIVARVAGGATSIQAIQAAWPEYQFKLTLDGDLLDLMAREGAWIRERGIIKNVEITEALFKSHINSTALRSVAPKAVTLP